MRLSAARTLLVAFCVGIALGQLAAAAWAAQTHRVSQKGRAFAVKAIDVTRGDTLEFTNEDEFLHQIYVKSPAMNFDSNEQAPGETIDVRFATPGSFEVRCHIHPTMLLLVTVK